MRSTPTMKVSLTPDRLKTMEVCAFIWSQHNVKTLNGIGVQARERSKGAENDSQ